MVFAQCGTVCQRNSLLWKLRGNEAVSSLICMSGVMSTFKQVEVRMMEIPRVNGAKLNYFSFECKI